MQVIILILGLVISGIAYSDENLKNDSVRNDDKRVAQHFGYKPQELILAHKEAKARVNTDKLSKRVLATLERLDLSSAELADEAMENMLRLADSLLRAEGHDRVADDIANEYIAGYRNGFARMFLGMKEIGDHPPISEWLQTVHKRIHDALGDFLCQWSHLHDMYILNHSNVVFKPKMAKDLKDYKDHFAGHLIWGWWWEHHGFAGVATYWVINGACIGASYGLGIITFVCNPIATYAEHVVDKTIAPPIAEKIWERVHQDD